MINSFATRLLSLGTASLLCTLLACSRQDRSTESATFANNMEARMQNVIPSQNLDYIVSYRTLSVLRDLDSVIANVRGLNPQRSALSCFVTEEAAGLFLCVGNNKAAQHIPLNRAAIFAESRPPLGIKQSGVIVPQQTSESGYEKSSGHDLTEQNLQVFFQALKARCPDASCILPGEMDFAQKVMPEFSRIYPYGYSVLSVDTSSGDELKRSLRHEISHGQFFQQQQYRAAVYGFWNSLSPELRIAASVFMGKSYDQANIDLIINEFHAFTLDNSYANIPDNYLVKLAQSDPNHAASLRLLTQNAAYLRESLLTYLRAAVPLVLYEKL